LISHFFCYSYGDPRDLHSFPTRRSSDLGRKEIDLVVEAPVDDYRDLPGESVWPSVFDRLLELIREHTSTIVFVNNRRLAERIADQVNERADEQICRVHHGSVSREARSEVEEMLKRGALPALIATSSMELG